MMSHSSGLRHAANGGLCLRIAADERRRQAQVVAHAQQQRFGEHGVELGTRRLNAKQNERLGVKTYGISAALVFQPAVRDAGAGAVCENAHRCMA